MRRSALHHLLDRWLDPERFQDVAHNGLQVEGREEIRTVICGVSANAALIEEAVAAGADALFVHHGLVWGDGIQSISGWLGKRIVRLIESELNLFAYHLPLDAHPELGNNAGLARALGLDAEGEAFGAYKGQTIGTAGHFAAPLPFEAVSARVSEAIGDPVFQSGDPAKPIERVAICSGGAPDLLYEAVASGYDLFITGEATEWVKAVAEETGTAFIAAGHHATERFGPRAMAVALDAEEGLEAQFIDIPNPL